MKYNAKTIKVTMFEKENGEKLVIFPNTKVIIVVDASKAIYDEWFVEQFYKKYYDEKKNVYNFEIYDVKVSKNMISGYATGRKDYLSLSANRSWLLDVIVLDENKEAKAVLSNEF